MVHVRPAQPRSMSAFLWARRSFAGAPALVGLMMFALTIPTVVQAAPPAADATTLDEAPDVLRDNAGATEGAEGAPGEASAESADELAARNRRLMAVVAGAGAGATAVLLAAQVGLLGLAFGLVGEERYQRPRNATAKVVNQVANYALLAGCVLPLATPVVIAAAVTLGSWSKGGRFWWTIGIPTTLVALFSFPVFAYAGGFGALLVLVQLEAMRGSYNTTSLFVGLATTFAASTTAAIVGSGLLATSAAVGLSNVELLGPVVDEWTDDDE